MSERFFAGSRSGPSVRFWPRLCKNAGSVLKSALLLKICQCLVSPQTRILRRSAIFVPTQTAKPARKRFYTASTHSGHFDTSQAPLSLAPGSSTDYANVFHCCTLRKRRSTPNAWPMRFATSLRATNTRVTPRSRVTSTKRTASIRRSATTGR